LARIQLSDLNIIDLRSALDFLEGSTVGKEFQLNLRQDNYIEASNNAVTAELSEQHWLRS